MVTTSTWFKFSILSALNISKAFQLSQFKNSLLSFTRILEYGTSSDIAKMQKSVTYESKCTGYKIVTEQSFCIKFVPFSLLKTFDFYVRWYHVTYAITSWGSYHDHCHSILAGKKTLFVPRDHHLNLLPVWKEAWSLGILL